MVHQSSFNVLLCILLVLFSKQSKTQVIWNTGSFTFTKSAPGQEDCLTPQTCLTRNTVLYNSVCEVVSGNQGCGYLGPCNTEWAVGNIANWNSLTYQRLYAALPCPGPPAWLGTPVVCHLIAENIYLQITFNSWQTGGSNFSYTRTTGVTLPVGLVNFTGVKTTNAHLLYWTTSSETNFSHYNLQRSNNGTDFITLKRIASKSIDGHSSVKLEYSCQDSRPLAGLNYYRLEQVDKDDKKSYSKVVNIRATGNEKSVIFYQYPDHVQFAFNTEIRTDALLTLLDQSGRVLYRKQLEIQQGVTTSQISTVGLSSGLYIVHVSIAGNPVLTKKLFKAN